jgi:hypothetical protein
MRWADFEAAITKAERALGLSPIEDSSPDEPAEYERIGLALGNVRPDENRQDRSVSRQNCVMFEGL